MIIMMDNFQLSIMITDKHVYLGRKYENNGEKIPEKTLLSNLCAEFWVCWKEKEWVV